MKAEMTKKTMSKAQREQAKTLLQKPYSRLVTPESDGSFYAQIREFEGCVAIGRTAEEAMESLEDIACSWIEGMLEAGQQVPEPMVPSPFSGRLVLRMPRSLHERAAQIAELEGVSLNQFITNCVATAVGAYRSTNSDRDETPDFKSNDLDLLVSEINKVNSKHHLLIPLLNHWLMQNPPSTEIFDFGPTQIVDAVKLSGFQSLTGVPIKTGSGKSSNVQHVHPYFGKKAHA